MDRGALPDASMSLPSTPSKHASVRRHHRGRHTRVAAPARVAQALQPSGTLLRDHHGSGSRPDARPTHRHHPATQPNDAARNHRGHARGAEVPVHCAAYPTHHTHRLHGAVDIRPAVPLSLDGGVLSSVQLATVAATLQIALSVNAAIRASDDDGTPRWPALAASALSASESDRLHALVDAIRHCVQENGAGVLDRASATLAEARGELRVASQQQTTMADQWAKRLHAGGAAERPQVVVRRDRLCVPVKAGRRGDLPSGSVQLGSSNSGSTLYMEPAPLVEWNNAVTLQRGRVDEEELTVLRDLSLQVAAAADALRAACTLLVSVDVANARAAHARWGGGVMPDIAADGHGAHVCCAWCAWCLLHHYAPQCMSLVRCTLCSPNVTGNPFPPLPPSMA